MTGVCERCGNVGEIQEHHWAMKIAFGEEEAETWPKSGLCIPCHQEWHGVMLRWANAVRESEHIPEPLIDARTRNDYLPPLSRLGESDE